jgi:hypothetical protein
LACQSRITGDGAIVVKKPGVRPSDGGLGI